MVKMNRRQFTAPADVAEFGPDCLRSDDRGRAA